MRLSRTESQSQYVLCWDGKGEKHCLTIPENTVKGPYIVAIPPASFLKITNQAAGSFVQELLGSRSPGD